MTLAQKIQQPEGRRLEFKEALPEKSDLAKTICAFANDAGGELYIGIKNDPRIVVGLPEDRLFEIENQISNIIFERCYPAILPNITFVSEDDKSLLKITVYPGNTPPYFLREKGKLHGTYVRIGSSNRLADETILAGLERKRRNISYDSEIVMEKTVNELNIEPFKVFFNEKTDEILNYQTLKKLELFKTEQNVDYPTNALVLLSNDALRNSLFHFAKVECARFKGTDTEIFIDQKSITGNIAIQAEEAYEFVMRHINRGATVKGVYTVSQWEYPIKAIREVIRNAVVHRDYSLTGKDIKVAIFDDMVEITSPGMLLPSIDYSAMESRQSDARNKVIAPVFKHLGIIDQWGNGLQLVAREMRNFPHIRLIYKEVGNSFQVQFVNLMYNKEEGQKQELQQKLKTNLSDKIKNIKYADKIIEMIENNPQVTAKEMSEEIGITNRTVERILSKLLDRHIIIRIGATKSGKWDIVSEENVGRKSEEMSEEITPINDNLNNVFPIKNIKYADNILDLIKKNPQITAREMSKKIGITTRTVERTLSKLLDLHIIIRIGATKSGEWDVMSEEMSEEMSKKKTNSKFKIKIQKCTH